MEKSEEKEVGKVFDYFSKVGVAAVKVGGKIKKGDKIHIVGNTTDFEQEVESMQIDNKDVDEVKKGDDVGIKVKDRVRKNDRVLLVE